ncbi:MAG: thiamine-phosphate kinase [Nitrospinae bacterium]|nr:thiamine-phosphate kinase [Nitrospinota bacterium]
MAKLKNLGEFGLIDRLSKSFNHQLSDTVLPLGDDCAVYSGSPSKYQLVSTDALVENIHFKFSTISPEQLGQKAIAVNISDIAAMGGIPTRVLITLGISKKVSTSFLDKLYKGIHKTCSLYNIELFGGDTVSSPKSFFINVTIIGEAKREKLFTRNGAKKGDLIFTTGTLGDSALGLKIQSKKNWKCSSKSKKYINKKHLNPTPRLKESRLLVQSNCKITSMIDISDGLAQDLQHICKQSGTGALIYEEKLPQSPAFFKVCTENKLNPLHLMLGGGEDYELLFTLTSDGVKNLYRQFEKAEALVTHIGEMTESVNKVSLLRKNGKRERLHQSSGFNHF